MKKRVTQDDTTAAEGKQIPRLYLREVSPTDDDGPYEGIGADLRAARVETGVDIAAVADNLRISRDYLAAIEDGRFGDLPGSAYVYGFLRSYAEYLNLEPKAVIAKYKSESELPRSETKLAFPSPMDRGRLPTGRLLASSLVLAGLVYAGWYIVSGGQRQSAEVVSAVPERLAAIIDNSGAAGQQVPGIAAPVQDVAVAPAGPLEETPIAGETQTQIPAPLAPAPQVASAGEALVADTTNEPALPLRRQEEEQVAALPPEEAPAVAVTDDAPAPLRAEDQAVIEQPATPVTRPVSDDAPATRATTPSEPVDEFGGLGAFEEPAATPTPARRREETVTAATAEPVATPAGTEDTSRPQGAAETYEAVAPAVVEAPAAAAPPRREEAEETPVVAVELPPVIEPVRADVQIAAASPTPQQIAEEEQVGAALAASPVIEQTPLPPPEPRAVPTEPAFLAAERAINEASKRRRLTAADADPPSSRAQFNQRRQVVAAEEQPRDEQAAVTARPRSAEIVVADALPAVEPETSSQETETVQLAAARRISELTNNETAANGAVRSFPVPPPIPEGTQTAALNRRGGYVPQVFGASNEDSRVVIEARLESWVQVRGRSGETLLTRILRVGDKYLVPNRPNLVMMTGNAGALKIMVDGKEIGPLGPPGAVLRNVSLEPSQLLARASSQ